MPLQADTFQGRVMPGAVALCVFAWDAVEMIFARLAGAARTEAERDEIVKEWEEFRDAWKPVIDRLVLRGGR